MHTQQGGHFLDRAALFDKLAGMCDLLRCQRRWRAELNTTGFGGFSASLGAVDDEGAIEFSQAGKDGEHHAPGRAGGISPRLGQTAQVCACTLNALGNVEQVAGAACQAIEPGDEDNIALAKVIEQTAQFRTLTLGTGDLLGIEATTTNIRELFALEGEVLGVGADAGVAEVHGVAVCRSDG